MISCWASCTFSGREALFVLCNVMGGMYYNDCFECWACSSSSWLRLYFVDYMNQGLKALTKKGLERFSHIGLQRYRLTKAKLNHVTCPSLVQYFFFRFCESSRKLRVAVGGSNRNTRKPSILQSRFSKTSVHSKKSEGDFTSPLDFPSLSWKWC